MKTKFQYPFLAVSLTVLTAAFAGTAWADDDDLKLSQTPEAVQATVRDNLRGGKVDDIDRVQLEGRTMYKVEVDLPDRKGGDDDDLKLYIDADGKLLKSREDMAFSALPAAVQTAARNQGGEIEDVERVSANGTVSYEVEFDDPDLTIVFSESGEVMSRKSDD
ncbi:hypothetical protein FEM03_03545 [Phragmitibacter flavus]|uniref:Putative beta-lactamase-inhibitor-like PepSY-like domain-containing protein n=1 Tax=Phragmitibacter flavus TaxID=2576071 RepID=A0A5R8KJK6_9BACT|nr:PepSY-like domain-containing protein [Phragmitibacter flavus]TLD72440.1 hypothetical protein FEM03_03545 [Phragmitibacter flavus]